MNQHDQIIAEMGIAAGLHIETIKTTDDLIDYILDLYNDDIPAEQWVYDAADYIILHRDEYADSIIRNSGSLE